MRKSSVVTVSGDSSRRVDNSVSCSSSSVAGDLVSLVKNDEVRDVDLYRGSLPNALLLIRVPRPNSMGVFFLLRPIVLVHVDLDRYTCVDKVENLRMERRRVEFGSDESDLEEEAADP